MNDVLKGMSKKELRKEIKALNRRIELLLWIISQISVSE